MNGILRAALASLLLAAQCALSFHHHDVSLALRSSRNFHSTCVISADDDCALCSFQVQARSVAPVAV
ncbi:MAG TPA: hypothetical protein VH309_00235, partial [Elusimicrobiota bacterium]|nr:hypothetical protein [Elusimicrobiota bacterium]